MMEIRSSTCRSLPPSNGETEIRANGEERTEWHRVVIFDERLGEVAQKYLHKGSKVYLEGQIQTRKWTDQQGQERYTTEVVLGRFRSVLTMLDSRGEGGGGGGGYEPAGGGSQGGGSEFRRRRSGRRDPVLMSVGSDCRSNGSEKNT